jgi:hypothetical protein
MKHILLRCLVLAFGIATLMVLLAGCILPGGGVGYDDGGGIGAAYYEPFGVEYGGWGPGYQVAPFRGGGHRPTGGGGHSSAHAYRSAPASRSMPSLPSHGGGRGGGGGRR